MIRDWCVRICLKWPYINLLEWKRNWNELYASVGIDGYIYTHTHIYIYIPCYIYIYIYIYCVYGFLCVGMYESSLYIALFTVFTSGVTSKFSCMSMWQVNFVASQLFFKNNWDVCHTVLWRTCFLIIFNSNDTTVCLQVNIFISNKINAHIKHII